MSEATLTPLEAPCIFCGYNGPDYWQINTHSEGCPWRTVGGSGARHEHFREALQHRLARHPADAPSVHCPHCEGSISGQECPGVHPADEGRELPDREKLGRIVRAAWVAWAKDQPNPKPTWLVEWDHLLESDKEADRRIGEAVARTVLTRPAPASAEGLTVALKHAVGTTVAQWGVKQAMHVEQPSLIDTLYDVIDAALATARPPQAPKDDARFAVGEPVDRLVPPASEVPTEATPNAATVAAMAETEAGNVVNHASVDALIADLDAEPPASEAPKPRRWWETAPCHHGPTCKGTGIDCGPDQRARRPVVEEREEERDA